MLQLVLLALSCAVVAGSSFAIVFLLARRRMQASRREVLPEDDRQSDWTPGAPRVKLTSTQLFVQADGGPRSLHRAAPPMILPMSTDVNVPLGASAQIENRPASASFSPRRVVVYRPEEWTIDGVTIDGVSQLKAPVRADELVLADVPWDVVGRGRKLAMTVTYLGDREEGARFQCALVGTSVGSSDLRLPFAGEGAGAEAIAG